MKWTKDKIERQRKYFREQRENSTGKFTEFVVRTYYYIYQKCSETEDGSVSSYITNDKDLLMMVYSGFYDEPDHMGGAVVADCVEKLKQMGYIGFNKASGKWKIYIKRELDFLKPGEHEEYIKKYSIGE